MRKMIMIGSVQEEIILLQTKYGHLILAGRKICLITEVVIIGRSVHCSQEWAISITTNTCLKQTCDTMAVPVLYLVTDGDSFPVFLLDGDYHRKILLRTLDYLMILNLELLMDKQVIRKAFVCMIIYN